MRGKRLSTGLRAVLAIFIMTLFGASTWAATHEEVLHNFNGTDGSYPLAGLIFDAAGNLYGTTSYGGTYGYGTVFEMTPNPDTAAGGWTEHVLHSFTFITDGVGPEAGLIFEIGRASCRERV